MGFLFGGNKTQSVDSDAAEAARLNAQLQQQDMEAQRQTNDALNKQLADQQAKQQSDQDALLKTQKDAADKLLADQQAKQEADAKQAMAQNVTGATGVNFNDLNQGALALQGKQGGSAMDQASNLARLNAQQIYGANKGGMFNQQQTGGTRYYG